MIGLEPSTMHNPSTYMHFYGFSQKPFDAEPDLESLFLVKSQTEALISMIQGINERRGLILISGETGTGKTTILRYLQTKLPKKVKTVFISRVSIFFKEILKQITRDLGLPLKDEAPGFFLPQLRAHLAEGPGRNENVVVFVDDAQNLNKENFEDLLLLSQIQEGGVRPLQIILAGRPELETILESEGLRPLNRQIQTRLQIQPLLPEESRLFIEQRLQRAGRSSGEVFTPEALELIVSQGRGIFRNIIFLCEKAFQKGLDLQQKVIDAATIWKILAEMDVPCLEEPVRSQEITNRDALIRRLFQNPPRIVKPGIFAEILSFLKVHPSYVYGFGTFVLALIFYLGWEFLLTPSPSSTPRIETPSPLAKEQMPIPASKEKIVTSAQSGPIGTPDKRGELVASALDKKTDSHAPAKPKPEAKIEGKPAAKAPPKQPAKAEAKKESKVELKPEVQREIRFNEPVEVPKGKTLYSFAREYYHHANPTLIDYILESNPHIKDPDRVPTAQKIEIPEILEGTLLAQSPDGSWKIRLGTFESRQAEGAFKEEPLLKEKEIEIAPRQVSPATTWYRLYAGKFDTMEEAFKTVQELRKKGLLPAFKK
ncbi:MAG: ATPase [Deltaproteobacteria bacterium]|nr:ATPase [Deltaproteobacteria bacterium]